MCHVQDNNSKEFKLAANVINSYIIPVCSVRWLSPSSWLAAGCSCCRNGCCCSQLYRVKCHGRQPRFPCDETTRRGPRFPSSFRVTVRLRIQRLARARRGRLHTATGPQPIALPTHPIASSGSSVAPFRPRRLGLARFFIFIFLKIVFYRNIFSVSQFTGLYSYHPA